MTDLIDSLKGLTSGEKNVGVEIKFDTQSTLTFAGILLGAGVLFVLISTAIKK